MSKMGFLKSNLCADPKSMVFELLMVSKNNCGLKLRATYKFLK